VVVDEPVTDSVASIVAAPIFAEIAEYGVRILGIAPEGGAAGDGQRVRSEPAQPLAPETGEPDPLAAATEPAEAAGTGAGQ
jgi:hypothetical protein